MLPKERGDFWFATLALSDGEDKLDEGVFVGPDVDPVKLKEDYRGGGAGALVSVDKGVVLNDVEQIGRTDLKEIGVKQHSFKCRARRLDGRVKDPGVTKLGTSSVALDLIVMNGKHVVNVQEVGEHVGLLGEFLEGFPVSGVRLGECLGETGLTRAGS